MKLMSEFFYKEEKEENLFQCLTSKEVRYETTFFSNSGHSQTGALVTRMLNVTGNKIIALSAQEGGSDKQGGLSQ